MNDLLQAVLSKLDRGDGKEDQWPDKKGEYWALCPYHGDSHTGNFSVSAKGYKCFSCDAKGGLKALATHLGIAQGEIEAATWPATLENYSKQKALPLDFLQSLGLQNASYSGAKAFKMPYYDRGGVESLSLIHI